MPVPAAYSKSLIILDTLSLPRCTSDNVIYTKNHLWKMRVITVYDDEREEIITYISTYDMQGQSKEGKPRSNEVVKSPRLHIEHKHSHDKTILTRTFQRLHWHSLEHIIYS